MLCSIPLSDYTIIFLLSLLMDFRVVFILGLFWVALLWTFFSQCFLVRLRTRVFGVYAYRSNCWIIEFAYIQLLKIVFNSFPKWLSQFHQECVNTQAIPHSFQDWILSVFIIFYILGLMCSSLITNAIEQNCICLYGFWLMNASNI